MQAENTEITLATRLRRMIRIKGRSIREFSQLSGVPYRTLQDYLADKGKPGSEQLARIANAGIDVNFLLTGKARGSGYTIAPDAAPDDEVYYVLADLDVINAIDKKARDVVDELLKTHLRPGQDINFRILLEAYVRLFVNLANIFARSSPPLEDARRLGMSVDHLIETVLETASQIAVVQLMAQAREQGA